MRSRAPIVDIVEGGVATPHLVVVIFFTIRIRIVVLDVIRALERGGRQHVPDVLRRERRARDRRERHRRDADDDEDECVED